MALIAALMLVGGSGVVWAGSATWNVLGGGVQNWNANANWNPNTTFPNAIGDTASLNVNITAAATLNLNQAITIGTLNIGDSGNPRVTFTIAGNGGALTFDVAAGNATITKTATDTATDTISANITLNDNLDVTDAATGGITISGNIGDGGAGKGIAKLGAGTGVLILSGANTFSGGVTLSAGSLTLGSTTALGTGTFTISGGILNSSVVNLVNANNNAQSWNGNFTFTGTQNLNLGTGAVTLSAARQVTVTANTLTVGGAIGDGGGNYGLTKAGAGTLTLSGANTYGGDTTVSLGTLRLGAANVIPDGAGKGNVTVTGTLDLGGFSETINGLSGAGTVNNSVAGGPYTLTVGNNDATSAFTGVIRNTAGALAVTKTGTGTLTLSGANTFTGGLNLNAGRVIGTSVGAMGTAANTVFFGGGELELRRAASTFTALLNMDSSGGTIYINPAAAGNGVTHTIGALSIDTQQLSLVPGSLTTINTAYGLICGATTLTGDPTFDVAMNGTGAGTLTLGALGDGGTARTITKQNAGTLTLNTLASGLVAGTAVIINGGTISQGATSALGVNNPTLSITPTAGTGLYALGAFNQTLGLLTLGGASGTTANVTIAGTLTLGGNMTYDSANNQNAATISGAGTLALAAVQRTFTIGDSSAAATDVTVSSLLTGTGGFIKTGAGTLVLSGNNAGFTTVGIALNQGRVVGTAANALGNNTSTVTFGGGELELRAAATIYAALLNMDSSGGTIYINPAAAGAGVTHTIGALSIGSQQLSLVDGGLTTINTAYGLICGATTLTGDPTFDVAMNGTGAGTLRLGALGDGGTARTITKQNTGTLTLNTLASGLVAGTAVIINGGTISQGVTSALGVNNPTLSVTPTAGTGLYTIVGAFGQSISDLTLGGANGTTANVTFSAAGTLTLAGNLTYDATSNPNATTISGATGTLALGAAQRTFTIGDSSAAADDVTVSSLLTGIGGLLKTGAGTLVLSGNNANFTTVGIALNQGRVVGTAANALGNNTTTVTFGGGELELRAATTTFNTRLNMGASDGTITVNPAAAGNGVTHTIGALSIGTKQLSLVDGSLTTINTAYGLTCGATTLTGNPTFDVAMNGTGAGTLTLGALGDGGTARTITKQNTGTLTLNTLASGLVAGTAVIINGGTISQGVNNALGVNSPALSITPTAGTGLYSMSGAFAQTIGLLTLGGASGTAANITTGTGTLTLGGNVIYDATINPNGATISGNLNLGGATRTFTIGDSTATDVDLAVSAIIANGSLTKSGAGTLRLSGANTFTGTLTLNSGTLQALTSAQALGTGAATLTLAGGVLQFPDTALRNFGRNTTVSADATIVPDRSTPGAGFTYTLGTLAMGAETLTVTGGVNVTSGTAGLTFGAATTLSGSPTFDIVDPPAGGVTLLTLGAIANGANTVTLTGNGNFAQTGVWGAGAGGLTLDAAYTGIATLNQANTFTGPVTISNGTLRALTSAQALGTGAATLTLAGGMLQFPAAAPLNFGRNTTVSGDATIVPDRSTVGGGRAYTLGTLDIGANTLSVTGGVNVTSGTASLTFGATTLTGSPTFQIVDPAGGGVTLLTLGTIDNGANTVTLTGNGNFAQTGVWGPGSGGLILDAAYTGMATLSQANTYGGDTTVSGGTLRLGAANVIPDGAGAGNVTVDGTLDLTGFSDTINGLSGAGTVNNSVAGGPYTLTVGNNDASSAFSGVIQNTAGTLAVTKVGAGALTLSGANTFAGGTTLNAGTLNINNAQALGTVAGTFTISGVGGACTIDNTSAGAITTLNYLQAWNADFTFTGGQNLNLGTGAVTLSAARQVTVTANTLTVGGVIGDGGGKYNLTKAGVGTLTLGGANTYGGTTTVSAGTLDIASGGAIGSSTNITVAAGAQLTLESPGAVIGDTAVVVVKSGGGYGKISLASGNETVGNLYFDDEPQLAGTWGATGSGATYIDDNRFVGAGVLTVANGPAEADGAWDVDSGGRWSVPGNWLNQVIAYGANHTALFTNGITADRTVTNNYQTLTIGNLTFGSPGSYNWVVTDNVIQFNNSATPTISVNANAAAIGSVISSDQGFAKTGAGTLILTGSNTYTGLTTVAQGTLVVNGTQSATGVVYVAGGALLCGTGTVGVVNVTANGTLSPGNSPGILNISSNLVLDTGSVFAVELNGTNVGSEYDQVIVAGSVTLSEAILSASLGYDAQPGDRLFIIQNNSTGAVIGTFADLPNESVTNLTFGGQAHFFQISYFGDAAAGTSTGGNDVVLTGVALPAVDNDGGASNIMANSATLNGTLLTNGTAETVVYVYWGPTDGETNKSAWSNEIAMGNIGTGPFSTNIAGLSPGQEYFYRCYASNEAGEAWAPSSTNFTTHLPNIGHRVWLDADRDGIYSNEAGVPGVGVGLYDASTNLIKTTVTDAGGLYYFADLSNGTYVVQFVKPTNCLFSPRDQGTDDTVDSDADTNTGFTAAIVVTDGGYSNMWDAGMYPVTDLAVNKEVSENYPATNEVIWFTITLTNNGPSAASNIVVTEYWPTNIVYSNYWASAGTYDTTNPTNHTWSIDGPTNGDSATLIVTGRVNTAETGVAIVNRVKITGRDPYDTNPANDSNGVVIVTLVVLSRFEAFDTGEGVVVEWETASEADTAGFYLLRQSRPGDVFARVNEELLPAVFGSPQGGVYRFADRDAVSGQTCAYKLLEVEMHGAQRECGPFPVTPGGGDAGGAPAKTLSGKPAACGAYCATPPCFESEPRVSPLKQERLAARLASARNVATPAAAAMDAGPARMKIAIREKGVYRVEAGVIATALGLEPDAVMAKIAGGALRLSNRGRTVAYLPAPGGLYFFGEAIDSVYTDQNVYWLELGDGTTMASEPGGAPSPAPEPAGFAETLHFEQEHYALTATTQDPEADYWYWEYVQAGSAQYGTRSFVLHVDKPATVSDPGTLTVGLLGATSSGKQPEHHAVIRLNNVVIGEGRWSGLTSRILELTFDHSLLKDGSNTVTVTAVKDAGVPYSIFYLDSFDLKYRRRYEALNNSLLFGAGSNGVITVTGFGTNDGCVMRIDNPAQPQVVSDVTIDQTGGVYRASFIPASPVASYAAFAPGFAKAPVAAGRDAPSALKTATNVGRYLVITVPELGDAAGALVQHRRNRGLSAMLVYLEDIYDEFNDGIASPEAIRSFLAYAYAHWLQPPRYVLLAGEGTYDYKNHLGYGDSLVPAMMVAAPQGLFAADGRYADVNDDGVPEMAVGRLPAITSAELGRLIAKITAYENGAEAGWQKRLIAAADNPDTGGNFTATSDALLTLVPQNYTPVKVYLGELPLSTARSRLQQELNQGALFLNYFGHAGLDRFATEGLLTVADMPALVNSNALPVVTAMSCVMGRFEIPGYDSLAEALILKNGGGAVAIWSPSGFSLNDKADDLAQDFYGQIFQRGQTVLGEAIVGALQAYADRQITRHMLHIYNLLGDPAMQIAPAAAWIPPADPAPAEIGVTTVEAWRSIYFSPAELAIPEISANAADPDGDGITNLGEYGTGRNPKKPDTLPPIQMLAPETGFDILATFSRRKSAVDLACQLEVSADLQTWLRGEPWVVEVQVADDGNGVTETVWCAVRSPAADRRTAFVRLRIERSP